MINEVIRCEMKKKVQYQNFCASYRPSKQDEWQCSEKATKMRSICCASPGRRKADKNTRMQVNTPWPAREKLRTYSFKT